MKGGKARKTIDKILEIRRQEEHQAAVEAAGRSREVERAQEILSAAQEELEAMAQANRAGKSAFRRRIAGGVKGAELAMAQTHWDLQRTDLERAAGRVSELRKALGRARRALGAARQKLKQKSAERRAAEKYAGRLQRREATDRQRKEENGF